MTTIRCTRPLKAIGMTKEDNDIIESRMAAEGWPTDGDGKLKWKHNGENRPTAKLRIAMDLIKERNQPKISVAEAAALPSSVRLTMDFPIGSPKLAEVLSLLGMG